MVHSGVCLNKKQRINRGRIVCFGNMEKNYKFRHISAEADGVPDVWRTWHCCFTETVSSSPDCLQPLLQHRWVWPSHYFHVCHCTAPKTLAEGKCMPRPSASAMSAHRQWKKGPCATQAHHARRSQRWHLSQHCKGCLHLICSGSVPETNSVFPQKPLHKNSW